MRSIPHVRKFSLRTRNATRPRLVGKFVLAPREGWQGQILKIVDGRVHVQLFSWLDGRPTDVKAVPLSRVVRWPRFHSVDAWRAAGTRILAQAAGR